MKIKIKTGAYASGNNVEFTKFLNKNAGKFVNVETEHLFNNQYNIAKFRILDSQISEVKNDARINMGKCNYCGKMHTKDVNNSNQFCTENKECKQYKINWFTPENTYFLKYPKGAPMNKEIAPQMIGSYKLTFSDGFYWLNNARKVIKFRYNEQDKQRFIVFDSIGEKQTRYLDIPELALNRLLKVLKDTNK